MRVKLKKQCRYNDKMLAERAKFMIILFLVSMFIVDAMSTKAAELLSKPRRECDNRFCVPENPPMTTPVVSWEVR